MKFKFYQASSFCCTLSFAKFDDPSFFGKWGATKGGVRRHQMGAQTGWATVPAGGIKIASGPGHQRGADLFPWLEGAQPPTLDQGCRGRWGGCGV